MKSAVYKKVLCTLTLAPSGFPEQVNVPQPFLEQINTPLCIWLVRILVIGAFAVCLLYAHYVRPEYDCREQEAPEAELQPAQREEEEGGK